MRSPGDQARMGSWCETHQRLECTRQRSRDRGPCHGSAVTGTDACRMHLGKTVEAAHRAAVTAWAAQPGDHGISPRDAVSAQLALAWRRALLLGEELRRQVEAAGEWEPALAGMEAAERDRVVKYAATAHGMGVADYWKVTARQTGERLVDVLERALSDLDGGTRDEVMARFAAGLGALDETAG